MLRAALVAVLCAACGSRHALEAPAANAPLDEQDAASGARLAREARAAALQPVARRFQATSRSTLTLAGEAWTAQALVLLSEAGFRARGEVRAPSGEARELELGREQGRYVFVDHSERLIATGDAPDLGGAWSAELARLASAVEGIPADGAGCRSDGVQELAGEECRVVTCAALGRERTWWIDARARVRRASERLALERAETRVVTVTLDDWSVAEESASIAVALPPGYERRASSGARSPASAEAGIRAPLVLDASFDELRTAFERSRDRLRVVAFLAPTCRNCLRLARALGSEVLARHAGAPLAVLIVWTDVLASDGADGALRASAIFDDPRVEQFHDPDRHAARAFAALVGMPAASAVGGGETWEQAFQPDFVHGAPALFDTVLFFAPGSPWTSPAPAPSAWVTQLDPEIWKGIEPARFRYGEALGAELARWTGELLGR